MPGPGTRFVSAVAGRFEVPKPKEGAEAETFLNASSLLYALGAGYLSAPLTPILCLFSEPKRVDRLVVACL